LFSSRLSVKRGDTLQLALALDVGEGWHLYGPNPDADFLIPTSVNMTPTPAFSVGNVKAPKPRKKLDPVLKQTLATYEGRIWYFVPVTVSKNATVGQAKLTVQVKTQACDQSRCLPPRIDEIALTLNVTAASTRGAPRHPTVFKDVSSVDRK
ncbi:hypothetical protein LCGC14_1482740, partial [marine sediment metagenome]